MKLSDYAEKLGVSYRTAWRMFHKGHIPGAYQLPSGTIIVPETKPAQVDRPPSVAVYCQASSSQNKTNLDSQCKRLTQYGIAGGYRITRAVKEIGSGINDQRKRFLSLFGDVDVQIIVVEHQDRATRFGFNYIQTMLHQQNRRLEVVNEAENDKDELMQDLVSIIP
jgi:putative resolvase